jgi:hypothetical protein
MAGRVRSREIRRFVREYQKMTTDLTELFLSTLDYWDARHKRIDAEIKMMQAEFKKMRQAESELTLPNSPDTIPTSDKETE